MNFFLTESMIDSSFFTDTVRKEAATITAVFPSPSEVMSILVQVPKKMVFNEYCGLEQVV